VRAESVDEVADGDEDCGANEDEESSGDARDNSTV
jgi:hypothetical protein